MRIERTILLAASILLGAIGFTTAAETRPASDPAAIATPLPSTNLHNLFRATDHVLSGSSPEGNAAFAELKQLGVKTIISVDGSKPDVETARKHRLHYIHLPIGYDGVPTNRVAELVKAVQSQPGPIYVHCHHGKHRGPAAVAVICEGIAGWNTNQAVAWLKEAGTSDDYAGLYRSAMEFHRPEATALSGIIELPEVARTSSLVETMVAIDAEFDHLKAAQKSSWAWIPDQPEVMPSHIATILWEHFRELLRKEDTASRTADYRTKASACEQAADQLRLLLRDARSDAAARDAAFQSLGKSCISCHKQYRD